MNPTNSSVCPTCKSVGAFIEDDYGSIYCNICGTQSEELFTESFDIDNAAFLNNSNGKRRSINPKSTRVKKTKDVDNMEVETNQYLILYQYCLKLIGNEIVTILCQMGLKGACYQHMHSVCLYKNEILNSIKVIWFSYLDMLQSKGINISTSLVHRIKTDKNSNNPTDNEKSNENDSIKNQCKDTNAGPSDREVEPSAREKRKWIRQKQPPPEHIVYPNKTLLLAIVYIAIRKYCPVMTPQDIVNCCDNTMVGAHGCDANTTTQTHAAIDIGVCKCSFNTLWDHIPIEIKANVRTKYKHLLAKHQGRGLKHITCTLLLYYTYNLAAFINITLCPYQVHHLGLVLSQQISNGIIIDVGEREASTPAGSTTYPASANRVSTNETGRRFKWSSVTAKLITCYHQKLLTRVLAGQSDYRTPVSLPIGTHRPDYSHLFEYHVEYTGALLVIAIKMVLCDTGDFHFEALLQLIESFSIAAPCGSSGFRPAIVHISDMNDLLSERCCGNNGNGINASNGIQAKNQNFCSYEQLQIHNYLERLEHVIPSNRNINAKSLFESPFQPQENAFPTARMNNFQNPTESRGYGNGVRCEDSPTQSHIGECDSPVPSSPNASRSSSYMNTNANPAVLGIRELDLLNKISFQLDPTANSNTLNDPFNTSTIVGLSSDYSESGVDSDSSLTQIQSQSQCASQTTYYKSLSTSSDAALHGNSGSMQFSQIQDVVDKQNARLLTIDVHDHTRYRNHYKFNKCVSVCLQELKKELKTQCAADHNYGGSYHDDASDSIRSQVHVICDAHPAPGTGLDSDVNSANDAISNVQANSRAARDTSYKNFYFKAVEGTNEHRGSLKTNRNSENKDEPLASPWHAAYGALTELIAKLIGCKPAVLNLLVTELEDYLGLGKGNGHMESNSKPISINNCNSGATTGNKRTGFDRDILHSNVISDAKRRRKATGWDPGALSGVECVPSALQNPKIASDTSSKTRVLNNIFKSRLFGGAFPALETGAASNSKTVSKHFTDKWVKSEDYNVLSYGLRDRIPLVFDHKMLCTKVETIPLGFRSDSRSNQMKEERLRRKELKKQKKKEEKERQKRIKISKSKDASGSVILSDSSSDLEADCGAFGIEHTSHSQPPCEMSAHSSWEPLTLYNDTMQSLQDFAIYRRNSVIGYRNATKHSGIRMESTRAASGLVKDAVKAKETAAYDGDSSDSTDVSSGVD